MKIKEIEFTPVFKRGYKRAKKKHLDVTKLERVIKLIVEGDTTTLIREYNDHQLVGSHKGLRELHIESDWLLVYKIDGKELKLYLLATGNHNEIFRESK